MKHLIFLLILSFNFSYSQSDTAQIVIPDRENTIAATKKPYVILISADGFRYDFAKKYNATNLLKLAESGVQGESMLPSFPSITFPNHYTIATGLYPAHHGLVDNYFYDYKRKETYAMSDKTKVRDGSWYGGIPLWSLAEKQGMIAASMFWVGSESDAGGKRPTYYYNYHEKFSPDDKVEKVINWLKLPEDKRPHFITLYFPEVDHDGHKFGPESPEAEQAVHVVDAAVGSLVAKVKELGLENMNFIFVSDHGMIKVAKEEAMDIPEILKDKSRFDYYNSQTLLRVFVKNPELVKETYKELKRSKNRNYKVYLDSNFPKRFHFSEKDDLYDRIGQILLVPKAPNIFLEKGKKTSVGKHGYDSKKTPEMRATFYAFGPAFKNNLKIKPFENIHVYPLIAQILGLKITEPVDGNIKTLENTLK
ncbi:alkaline phosphatase family protein [Frigoriflavimonas asaccharolytica]|uniref:Putative AlkP superfamily pyrophosphatase or phosphodiesterase n=1 Tax=Frigoriflavimonas asaccharolytica TaxID=2735899 RepID=A0A8J8KCD6_9FLAO|nr:ectonucleotide pyrophosphatase/phosphodiesterase [Frigoriflavimonas asaccharolytica]NRS93514.1 putative AlkP superfamily pyrophosphatase or phosphodiesterase [Frigoriflavimonas asaccharolytica]